jgi:hypothetical protein
MLAFVFFSSFLPLACPFPSQYPPLSPIVSTVSSHSHLRREMSFLGSGGKPSSEEETAGVEGWKAKLQQLKEKSDQIFDINPSGVRRRAKKNGNDKGKGDYGDEKGKNDKGKSDKGDEKGKDKSSGKNEKGKSDKGDGNKSDGKKEKGKDKKEKNDQKKDKKDKNSKEKSNKSPSTVTPPSRTLDLSLSTCDLYCDGLDAFCESAEDCCGEGFAVCDATVFDEPGYYHCGAKADYLGRCVEDEVIQHVVNGTTSFSCPHSLLSLTCSSTL